MDERNRSSRPVAPPGPRGGPGMRPAFERPKDARRTLLRVLEYLKYRKFILALTFFLMLLSSGATLAGSYFLKPLINDYILPGDFTGLLSALMLLALIYLAGVAATYLQNRLMVQTAQKTTNRMRRDLFVKMQSFPIRFFDNHAHGDLMSRYTNDLDNVQMALEQSLLQLITSALNFVGSIIMMLVLSPILSIVTFLVLALMFFISGKLAGKSRRYFREQQTNLGNLNG